MDGNTQAALDAGMALAEPFAVDPGRGVYSLVVPAGGEGKLVSVERWADKPRRAAAVYRPATVDSLIELCARHESEEFTTVWVHPTSGRIVAVFNDNSTTEPGWRDHRAVLQLVVPPPWFHWTRRDGVLMTQAEFAEHIEDGLADIAEPAAADMLELAQSFHAKQSAAFRSAVRLQDGRVQMQYDEEIEAKAGRSGQMAIPSEFKLALSPFLGEDPWGVRALLRYRIGGGKLMLGYKLQRPEDVVRDTLSAIYERLGEALNTVYLGSPEE
jgi:uncharacterized protein YfdQ (DUF2303 family)